jgi:membrane-associated HD superfamily phosphohydrolase
MLMATELDPPPKLSSPRIFLLRMLVFVALCAAVVFVLHKQIEIAFMANPALNSLIIFVLIVGTALSFRQVLRLYPEITWVTPTLLAPMAAILGSNRVGQMAISAQMLCRILHGNFLLVIFIWACRFKSKRSQRTEPKADKSAA